jgi:hypothetical protein
VRTHKEIFTEIYDKNVWGGSGGGSSPENTVEYRKLLQKFLKERNIKRVVDYGCGDWSFSHLINWSGIDYIGYDIVESVIQKNEVKHGKENIRFRSSMAGLDFGDLLILKDVMQHWANKDIIEFIPLAKVAFKYILITNTIGTSENDILPGDCRGLSAKLYPLKEFNPEVLAVIKTTITSEVSLITNI